MTFEERLERIAERHEALAQTVELLAHMQQKNEERLAEVGEHVDNLVKVVLSHERRITDMEGGAN